MSVSQLAARIDQVIKSGIRGRVVVAGEISSLTNRTHWYFSLKDSSAVVGAVVFASVARKMSYTPKHGDSVIATGRLEFYAPSGRVSFIIESMSPAGEGALEQRYRELCEQLRSQGWFDPLMKQQLPVFPRRIAIITSRTGAALQDVISTMGKRCPAVDLLVVDARVQGDQAAPQITEAIQQLNDRRDELNIDAILLTRGGGSLEDLWAFNELSVAEAIHESELPIVAAIGHETDTTIAELVADERCATPTQAAMKLTPDRSAMIEQLSSLRHRLDGAVRHRLRYERQSLSAISGSRAMTSPQRIIEIQGDRLDAIGSALTHAAIQQQSIARRRLHELSIRLSRHQPAAIHARRAVMLETIERDLHRSIGRRIERSRQQLLAIDRELHAIDPLQVLQRGFSVTTTENGEILRDADMVRHGAELTTRVASGVVRSRVIDEEDKRAAEPSKKKPRIRSRKTLGREEPPQMDLF
jgi:exodeoxyribonuclease VII large subunit